LRELVILRVGWLSGSDYEWGQHVLIARDEGVSDEEITRIKEGPDATGWNPDERAALRAVDELHRDQEIGDETWTLLRDAFHEQQCLDIIFTVGQYVLVCMALNSCGVQRDDGVPGFDD
jgi:alkylhydroperoxidase family enzyme